jgi:4-hydroxy-tetrahydrodipicolinate reductase
MLRIAVLGATGRMGIAVSQAVAASDDMQIAGALTVPGDQQVGADIGTLAGIPSQGVAVVDDPVTAVANADIAIDFTLPSAMQTNLEACVNAGCAVVMGTTGLDEAQQKILRVAGETIAIVYGRNMSVGVNVFTELARLATRYLGDEWDVEITEAHHRFKVDAPSGTALQLGEAVAAERGQELTAVARFDRHGSDQERQAGDIGFASIRAGSIVGDHSVTFAADAEIVELQHRALDRATFANGALRAARWVSGQTPSLYSMADVLGFED